MHCNSSSLLSTPVIEERNGEKQHPHLTTLRPLAFKQQVHLSEQHRFGFLKNDLPVFKNLMYLEPIASLSVVITSDMLSLSQIHPLTIS